ncbi:MAG: response regulator, partial [Pseudomonadota bacterium]
MKTQTVLCVDDDITVLNALRSVLVKTLGGRAVVEIAEDGLDALEICDELLQQGQELSVVISDFIMPGMRGDELLIRLHKMCPQAIKIMLTGQSDLQGIKRTINEANL